MDRATIEKLYLTEGPFVSVYLDSESEVENAAAKMALRWKDALDELEQHGVDEPTRQALSDALGSHAEGGTRALIACHGSVQLATSLPRRPDREVVRVGALPHVTPLVQALAEDVSYLVVLADRRGADILAYHATVPARVRQASVAGPGVYVHKTGTGGWAARRYEATAEEDWATNARAVAARLEAIASDVDAELVVATGDVHALRLLRDALPARLQASFVTVEGSRAEDGGDAHVAQRVGEAVGNHVSAGTAELAERYSRNRGRHEAATEGVQQTLDALRRAQVDVLLLTEDLDASQSAWFGHEPTSVGTTREELEGVDGENAQEAPLEDVLMRAALGTGAEIRWVTAGIEQSPRQGVGAILRYTLPNTAR